MKTKFYPKGEEAGIPNALGQHLIRTPSGGLKYISRKEARRKQTFPFATKPNYGYQKKKNGFTHQVNPANVHVNLPTKPPHSTNHTNHRYRQVVREAERIEARKQKEASHGKEANASD